VPIEDVTLYIYKADARATYQATLTSLPLKAGSKSYTAAETGGGAANVTATPGNGWAYITGTGYAYWAPSGAYSWGYGYGYGYGYGAGAVSITYQVTWTSPAGWPAGDYRIDARLTANGDNFTQSSSSFTLSTAKAPAVSPEPGIKDLTGLITADGVFISNTTAESADGVVRLTISKGTVGRTSEGQPLSEISIIKVANVPALPRGASTIGATYDLGPTGATFDPPITITFAYDEADIPLGTNEEELFILFWDENAGEWVLLKDIVVDPVANTISASVSHFTRFSVMALTRLASFERRLFGEKVGQHKVPPNSQVIMRIGVSVEVGVTSVKLIDYFPASWAVIDARGGVVSPVDATTNKIEWAVGDISAGGAVSREYVLFSPERTVPPTRYRFWSEISHSPGLATSGTWEVLVTDPAVTDYLHAADVVVGSTTYNTLNSTAPVGVLAELTASSLGSDVLLTDADGVSVFVSDPVPAGEQWDIGSTWTFNIYFSSDPSSTMKRLIVKIYKIDSSGAKTLLVSNSKKTNQSISAYPNYTLFNWSVNVPTGTIIGPGERFGVEFWVRTSSTTTVYLGFDTSSQNSRIDLAYTISTAPGNLREAHYRIGQDTPLSSMQWYEATDTKVKGIRRNTNFRVRFQVYNNGGTAKSWLPQLEYLTSGGTWTAVPTTSGTDPFFIAPTSQFNNGDTIATTDFALGPGEGIAQAGYAYDGSPPSAISLNAGSYTEIEFNVQANANAEYYTAYSFRLTDAGTAFSSYANYATISVWEDDNPFSPHYNFAVDTDKCASCHRAHTASGKKLRRIWPEEGLCNACHDGTGARTDIASQFNNKSYTHPISATQGSHGTGEGYYNWLPASNRHVECEDCHNPHAAWTGASTPGFGDLARTIERVWGVTVSNPTTGWTTLTSGNYTRVSPITAEYQLCFKCHSSYAYDTTPPLSHSGGLTETDQAKEFNVNNASYHWVETDQTAASGTTPRTNTGDRYMSFTPGSGMDKDTPMGCSNCHASETETEPRGPHGSNNAYLLRGTWSDTTTGTSYGLCLQCHDPNVYDAGGTNEAGRTSFAGNKPNLHAFHMSRGAVNGCQNCHSAIPHGGWTRAMVVQTTDPAPYSNGSKLVIASWASPGGWSKSNCQGGPCH
jgi:predicted CXXCH cytochrome family protein